MSRLRRWLRRILLGILQHRPRTSAPAPGGPRFFVEAPNWPRYPQKGA